MASSGPPRTAAGAAAAARAAAPYAAGSADSTRSTKCVVGWRFLKAIHGLFNIITIISLLVVLITAGMTAVQDTRDADKLSFFSNVQVSAFHTRNAAILFAVFGLILMIVDTVLHVTQWILRLPPNFDLPFAVVMLVFATIYFILGCCVAAWAKKMNDTVVKYRPITHKEAPAVAAFFLFAATIAILVDFILRIVRPPATEPK